MLKLTSESKNKPVNKYRNHNFTGLVLALRGFPLENSRKLSAQLIRNYFENISCFGYASNPENTYYFLYFESLDVLPKIREAYKPTRSRPIQHTDFGLGGEDGALIELEGLLYLMAKAKRQHGSPSVYFNKYLGGCGAAKVGNKSDMNEPSSLNPNAQTFKSVLKEPVPLPNVNPLDHISLSFTETLQEAYTMRERLDQSIVALESRIKLLQHSNSAETESYNLNSSSGNQYKYQQEGYTAPFVFQTLPGCPMMALPDLSQATSAYNPEHIGWLNANSINPMVHVPSPYIYPYQEEQGARKILLRRTESNHDSYGNITGTGTIHSSGNNIGPGQFPMRSLAHDSMGYHNTQIEGLTNDIPSQPNKSSIKSYSDIQEEKIMGVNDKCNSTISKVFRFNPRGESELKSSKARAFRRIASMEEIVLRETEHDRNEETKDDNMLNEHIRLKKLRQKLYSMKGQSLLLKAKIPVNHETCESIEHQLRN